MLTFWYDMVWVYAPLVGPVVLTLPKWNANAHPSIWVVAVNCRRNWVSHDRISCRVANSWPFPNIAALSTMFGVCWPKSAPSKGAHWSSCGSVSAVA